MSARGISLVSLAALVAGLAGCASAGGPSGSGSASDGGSTTASSLPAPDVAAPGLEETALLLLLVDRQLYEPFTIGRLLESPQPEVRAELALMLARVPDERALPILDQLATDADPRVRRAASFAAGRQRVKEALTLSELFLLDPDGVAVELNYPPSETPAAA